MTILVAMAFLCGCSTAPSSMNTELPPLAASAPYQVNSGPSGARMAAKSVATNALKLDALESLYANPSQAAMLERDPSARVEAVQAVANVPVSRFQTDLMQRHVAVGQP